MKDRDTTPELAPVDAGRRPLTESADELRAALHERRLDKLEGRADACEARHLRLTGVDDGNGRLGRIDRTIQNVRDELVAGDAATRHALTKAVAELRADVGTAEERREERAAAALVNGKVRRWRYLIGSVVALILGGGGWAVWQSHNASLDAAARRDQRMDQYDTDIDRLYDFCRAPRPDPARNP